MKFNKYRWNIPSHNSDVYSVLLEKKDLKTDEAKNRFLSPTIEDLNDPFLLSGMDTAVERIRLALSNFENIWIYGDYDVDGITSISILVKYLETLGGKCFYYIPNRESDGYGLSEDGLSHIKNNGGDLVISVDCGINAFGPADYAKQIGLDLIITDHHNLESVLPNALAVINPKISGYPFPDLAGCGVALKIVQALSGENFSNFFHEIIDLAAVGTVADVVPLKQENRVITSVGLKNITNPGLIALVEKANKQIQYLTSTDISFTIAPIINSCGRIGNPELGVELLTNNNQDVVKSIAERLYSLNIERRERGDIIMKEALDYISMNIDYNNEKVLIVKGECWKVGIIGIIASKLASKFSRPVIILSENDGILKGSSRSIRGISIYDIIFEAKEHLLKFGGHEQAAGLSLKAENLEKFTEAVKAAANRRIKPLDLVPTIDIDSILKSDQVDMNFVKKLSLFEPYGLDNEEPIFGINDLRIKEFRLVGASSNHVKLSFFERNLQAIGFGMAERFESVSVNDRISIAFRLGINRFRGNESLDMNILDIRSSQFRLSSDIKLRAELALAEYLINEDSPEILRCSALEIESLLEAGSGEILIYSLQDLTLCGEIFDKRNFYDYELVFGNEMSESPIVIRFAGSSVKSGGEAEKSEISEFSPSRKDIVRLFKELKFIKNEKIFEMSKLSLHFTQNLTKTVLMLQIMANLQVLEYTIINRNIRVRMLEPEVKKVLEEEALFLKLSRYR